MLVKDEATSARHVVMTEAEAERDQKLQWVLKQTEHAAFVRDDDTSPTNLERQLGRPLPDHVVEAKLRKINPQLRFEVHPYNPSKKIMFRSLPDGTQQKLMIYESGIIPEHSVMQAVIKEALHPDVLRGRFHIDRKDLTKHEVRPHEFNEDGTLKQLGDVVWDDTQPQVGMQRTKIPWAERIRGYRTMLAILVHADAITRFDAEKEFGSANRAEWAAHMGRRDKETPW